MRGIHTSVINIRNNSYNLRTETQDELEGAFDNSIRFKRKCFSTWKKIHIRDIDNPFVAVSYVNKETSREHTSLDWNNSIFL